MTRIHEQGQFRSAFGLKSSGSSEPTFNSISNLLFRPNPVHVVHFPPSMSTSSRDDKTFPSSDDRICIQLFHSSIIPSDKCPHGKCHDSATHARVADPHRNSVCLTFKPSVVLETVLADIPSDLQEVRLVVIESIGILRNTLATLETQRLVSYLTFHNRLPRPAQISSGT